MWSHFPHLEEEHSQANYIMGLIANTQLKIPSGLKVVPRGYPISGHTIVRNPRLACLPCHKHVWKRKGVT